MVVITATAAAVTSTAAVAKDSAPCCNNTVNAVEHANVVIATVASNESATMKENKNPLTRASDLNPRQCSVQSLSQMTFSRGLSPAEEGA